MQENSLAIVAPVHNRKNVTLSYLEQIKLINNSDIGLNIVIIDDSSTDRISTAIVEQYPEAIALKGDGSLWWTGDIKIGVEYPLGQNHKTILIMNNDLDRDKNFLQELLDAAKQHLYALINSVVLNKDANGHETAMKLLLPNVWPRKIVNE